MNASSAASGDDRWPAAAVPPPAALAEEVARFAAGTGWDRTALATLLPGPPAAALVVTGQQPAVGGGPLYTLVKVAHAVSLARSLGGVRGGVAPLFWCASEDHDLGEAGHADIIARSGDLHRLQVDLGPGRSALRHRPASLWFAPLMAHCRQHLVGGAGEAFLAGQQPFAGEGMGAWLCRLLTTLFARHQLRCVEGHRLRPLWPRALARALTAWPAEALHERRRVLLSSGSPDPFGELSQPPLFADRPEGRSALTVAEAAGLLERESEVLSPGAALRPVLQQIALPAAIYLAGPGELRYHAFIAPLYAALLAPRPRIVARASLTLVPRWVARGLERWGQAPEACALPPPVRPMADSLRPALTAVDDALAAAEAQATSLGDELRRRMATSIARLRRERARLERSLARGEAQLRSIPPWGALCGYLRPRQQLQERGMSLFQALWEHGPGLADALVEATASCAAGEHRYLTLNDAAPVP
jgi:hypothetical protein